MAPNSSHLDLLNYIGQFQFENLVNNRVPFLLFNFGIDFSVRYSGLALQHLKTYSKPISLDELEGYILDQKISTDYAIVCLCADGGVSKKAAEWLEKNKFINVYIVKGGWQALTAEAP